MRFRRLVLLLLVALALAVLLGPAPPAGAQGPIVMGIDPETTGNTANTLGTLQSCVRVDKASPAFDGVSDHTIDVYVTGDVDLPVAYDAWVTYDNSKVHVVDPTDPLIKMPSATDLSDSRPDSDGQFSAGAIYFGAPYDGIPGDGTLVRIGLDIGASGLVTFDFAKGTYASCQDPPTCGDTPEHDVTTVSATLAINRPCSAFDPDADVELSDYNSDANADITTTFDIPAEDYQYGVFAVFTPAQFSVAAAGDVPIGAVVGSEDALATLGLLNGPCVNILAPHWDLLNCSIDTGDTVSFDDGFYDFDPANDIPDGCDKYPDFLNTMYPGITPRARMYGQTSVGGTPVSLNFVVFQLGQALPGVPSLGGYPSAAVVNDPTAAPDPGSSITDYCAPLSTDITILGLSEDNPATTGEDESGHEVRGNPSDGGSYTFRWYTASLRDADGDGYENELDTCPFDTNIDGSPKESGPDPDGDYIDGACDPDSGVACWSGAPGSASDCDNDTYMNRGDNCPLDANADQADADRDGIGDVCDSQPSTPDGESINVTIGADIGISGPLSLKIGLLLPFTGALSDYGIPLQNAADLAALHINDSGGVLGLPITLVVADSETDSTAGVNAAQSLIATYGVNAIVGAAASGVTYPVAEQVTIPNQVLLVSPASTSPAITDLADNGLVFRTTYSDELQGAVLAQVAWDRGFTTACTMYIDDAYGQGLSNGFTEAFGALGGTVQVQVPHEDGQGSYQTEVETCAADEPQVMVAISYPSAGEVFLQDALDYTTIDDFVFNDGLKSQEMFNNLGGGSFEGMYGTAPATTFTTQFSRAYEAQYGEPPPLPFLAEAYDAVVSIALAAERAGSNNSLAIRDALHKVSCPPGPSVGATASGIARGLHLVAAGEDINYQGATGSLQFTEYGDGTRGFVEIWKIQGGLIAPDGEEPVAASPDTDADGFDVCVEVYLGTDPTDPDSDDDNVSDGPADPDDGGPIIAGPDNCPTVSNPAQEDTDADGVGDACDNCTNDQNPDQVDNDDDGDGDVCDPDDDNDTVADLDDNCPLVNNPVQINSDGDSHGDACDNCPAIDNEDQADTDLPATIDLDSDSAGLTVYGDDADDESGYVVATGDINDDGFDDLIIGAQFASPGGRTEAGETYVIYGDPLLPTTIDLDSISADLTVYGADVEDLSGSAVAAGDINGDGSDDLIIGAIYADGPGSGTSCGEGQVGDRCAGGEAYVIYGGPSLPSTINLQTENPDLTVYGHSGNDRLGTSVAAGDINGDGTDDVILGADGKGAPDRGNAGRTYVIYGGPSLPPTIDLNSTTADLEVYGDDTADYSGKKAAAADVNGDGIDDLITTAPNGDGSGIGTSCGTGQVGDRCEAGETYVIWGGPSLPPVIDLDSVSADLTVYGDDADDFSGYPAAAGDINGDGTDDLIIGALAADPPGGPDAGETYVIYGGDSLPAVIDLNSESADLTVYGDDAEDYSGWGAAAGDINGDGTDDLIISAAYADPPGGSGAGETYVIYGGDSLPATIDLDGTSADLTVYGDDFEDWSGVAVAAGDINGDGASDLVIGAHGADPGSRNYAGETYVIYGRPPDGLGDACDNCPDHYNPDQVDLDDDGAGDLCDPDTEESSATSHPVTGDVAVSNAEDTIAFEGQTTEPGSTVTIVEDSEAVGTAEWMPPVDNKTLVGTKFSLLSLSALDGTVTSVASFSPGIRQDQLDHLRVIKAGVWPPLCGQPGPACDITATGPPYTEATIEFTLPNDADIGGGVPQDSDGDTVYDHYDANEDEDFDDPGEHDNCPYDPNADQTNLDATDQDGDTFVDEDPLDALDNDADTLIDEDPAGDSEGDACDLDDDGDGFGDSAEPTFGSDPLDACSTPEHTAVASSCTDLIDNDGDTLTDGDDEGCPTAAANMVVRMSVDQSQVEAGAQDVPLQDIMAGGHLQGTPLQSIPLQSIPLQSIDIEAGPLQSIPIQSIPIQSITLHELPLQSIDRPGCVFDGWGEILAGTTLEGVPLQSITLEDVVQESQTDPTLQARLACVTVGDLALISAPLQSITLVGILLGTTPLQSIPLQSIPLGPADWCDVLAGTYFDSACSYDSGVCQSCNVSGLDIDQLLDNGVPLGSIPVQMIPMWLDVAPEDGSPDWTIDATPLQSITLEHIPIQSITGKTWTEILAGTGVDPVNGNLVDVIEACKTNATLRARLGDIDGLGTDLSLGHILWAILSATAGDLPWETIPLQSIPLQSIALHGGSVTYTIELANTGSAPATGVSIEDELPVGFLYEGPTTTGGCGSSVSGPAQSGEVGQPTTLTWTSVEVAAGVTCTLSFEAYASISLDTYTSSVSVSVPGYPEVSVDHAAPVTITENFEPNDPFDEATADSLPALKPGKLYLSYISSSTDVDFFRIPMRDKEDDDGDGYVNDGCPPVGTADGDCNNDVDDDGDGYVNDGCPADGSPESGAQCWLDEGDSITVYLSHLASDNDLVMYSPVDAPWQSTAMQSIPIGGVRIDDIPLEETPLQQATLQDTVLDDIAIQDVPIQGVPIESVSIGRGTAGETVADTALYESGDYYIQVSGYNGVYSGEPYVIRVKVQPPSAVVCSDRSLPDPPAPPGEPTIPHPIPGDVNTLIITNEQRLQQYYGHVDDDGDTVVNDGCPAVGGGETGADCANAVDDDGDGYVNDGCPPHDSPESGAQCSLMDKLDDLALATGGAVVPVDYDADVRAAFAEWDTNPCSISKTMAVAGSIRTLVHDIIGSHSSVQFLVIVGSDEIIPFARVPDEVYISNERLYSHELSWVWDSALYGALAQGFILTDDFYADLAPIPWFERELYVPDLALGRLVEEPPEIEALIDHFLAHDTLNPSDAFVTGYDFLEDGANAIASKLKEVLGSPWVDDSLINSFWTRAHLCNALDLECGTGTDTPHIDSLNAHYDHYRLQPAACGDDDADTVVNDGCPAYDATASEDGCGTGTCSNSIDDGGACDGTGTDGADYADDDCLGSGGETGTDCDNAVDDDADTVVNDGCPPTGDPESGDQCAPYIDDLDPGDLVTTADIPVEDTTDTRFNGSILFSLGCHSGLSVCDCLLGSSDPRLRDFPQAWAERRAHYVGNTGYGYGDTEAVALSERLMKYFAGELFAAPTSYLGEALVRAKQRYYLSMGSYPLYDEKAMIEATLYGLPMYKVTDSGSTPPSEEPPCVTLDSGLLRADLQLSPLTLNPNIEARGTYYDVEGEIQVTPYRAIQPRTSQNVSIFTDGDCDGYYAGQGYVAHGALLADSDGDDVAALYDQLGDPPSSFNPVIARPTWDLESSEPEPQFVSEGWFPSALHTINHLETGGDVRERLVVIPGQFRRETFVGGQEVGTERIYDSLDFQVYYSQESDDFTRPTFKRVEAVVSGSGVADFTVEVTDLDDSGVPGQVRRVVVIYTESVAGEQTDLEWKSEDLQWQPGDVWEGSITGLPGSIDYLVQAVDAAGNVGFSTNKGLYYDALDVDAGSIGNVYEGDPVSFAGDSPDASPDAAGTLVIWDFGDGSTAIDTLTPTHKYADNGNYTVTLTVSDASGRTGSDTLSVAVSNVAPVVDVAPSLLVATAGLPVTFQGSFTDPGFGDTHTIHWDFGDGTTTDGVLAPSHVFGAEGSYVVELVVSDDDGGTDSATAGVVVTVDDICDGVDNNLDGQVDEGWDANTNGIRDCEDPYLNTDGDGLNNKLDDDDDGDGFKDATENWMGTNPLSACLANGWPFDFDDNGVVDVTDALIFLGHFPSALGSPNYAARSDFNADGVIDVTDALMFLAHFPSAC